MRTILLSAFCALSITVSGQLNLKPSILGQNAVSTKENTPVTIQLTDLIVLDLDDLSYPAGFTLEVSGGKDYDLQGNTVTPKPNFIGTLKVKVKVNDGQDDSNEFELRVSVINNVKPVINGQEVLTMNQGESFTIQFSHLHVTDSDNDYPEDFTLKIYSGANYTVNGSAITPAASFTGDLTVQVTVDDGIDESAKFNLKIEVIKAANVPPQITGQNPLTTQEDKAITLKLGDLKVTDPDNSYPTGFTMKASEGSNYTVSGLTVSPALNFSGVLSVPVTVNDGTSESLSFLMQITVAPENDSPIITAQAPLSTNKNVPVTVEFSHLAVTDPDNEYPTDFTMTIAAGANYTVSSRTITPAADFTGILNADVIVNDGKINSSVYKLKVTVNVPVNIRPVITGQQSVTTIENNEVTLQLTDLIVSDADNDFPEDFSMTLSEGSNYTFSGRTVTPAQNFTGNLTVKITVNDGTISSEPFNFKIVVQPGGEGVPLITGQKSLRIKEDETLTLVFTHISVEDKDNVYPTGFRLNVLDGENYTNDGLKIIPDRNFNGYLVVGITVNDGMNTSPPFNLAVLIDPVNDPPEITSFETDPLSFEPGNESIAFTEIFDIADVDDEMLSFAEVGIRPEGYNEINDVLIFNTTATIRGVYDTRAGILSLIGNAPVSEYRDAIRSIRYDHMTRDASDMPVAITPGPKIVYLNLSDGKDVSLTHERTIMVETILLDIPTGFTPNGDRANDTWEIRALTSPDQFETAIIRVYNKRGLMVHQSTGFEHGWDGVFNGDLLPADTYFYTIDLKLTYTRKNFQGVVTILR